MPVKGKWAQGIDPRNFRWVIKDRLAVCERPGGYGANHRRVRRQEEIIWVREQGFAPVISIIASPANLHNYTDPMPQALVLTAIVIGFAMTALFLVVLLALRGFFGNDHVDGQEDDQ